MKEPCCGKQANSAIDKENVSKGLSPTEGVEKQGFSAPGASAGPLALWASAPLKVSERGSQMRGQQLLLTEAKNLLIIRSIKGQNSL